MFKNTKNKLFCYLIALATILFFIWYYSNSSTLGMFMGRVIASFFDPFYLLSLIVVLYTVLNFDALIVSVVYSGLFVLVRYPTTKSYHLLLEVFTDDINLLVTMWIYTFIPTLLSSTVFVLCFAVKEDQQNTEILDTDKGQISTSILPDFIVIPWQHSMIFRASFSIIVFYEVALCTYIHLFEPRPFRSGLNRLGDQQIEQLTKLSLYPVILIVLGLFLYKFVSRKNIFFPENISTNKNQFPDNSETTHQSDFSVVHQNLNFETVDVSQQEQLPVNPETIKKEWTENDKQKLFREHDESVTRHELGKQERERNKLR
jgi:hypothetical protein